MPGSGHFRKPAKRARHIAGSRRADAARLSSLDCSAGTYESIASGCRKSHSEHPAVLDQRDPPDAGKATSQGRIDSRVLFGGGWGGAFPEARASTSSGATPPLLQLDSEEVRDLSWTIPPPGACWTKSGTNSALCMPRRTFPRALLRRETQIRHQSLGRVEQRFDDVEARLRREELADFREL